LVFDLQHIIFAQDYKVTVLFTSGQQKMQKIRELRETGKQ
jgi:hypothetical protein